MDVQSEIAHWVLPDGRCVAWTVAELARKKADELVDLKARALYFAIGEEVEYLPQGMLPDEIVDAYRDAPGTLEERQRLSSHWCLRQLNIATLHAHAVAARCAIRFMAKVAMVSPRR